MKDTNDLSGRGIAAGNVRPFVPVAMKACEGEIIDIVCALVLPGDDVVHLKWKAVVGKRDTAVFASIACPLPDFLNQSLVHCNDERFWAFR